MKNLINDDLDLSSSNNESDNEFNSASYNESDSESNDWFFKDWDCFFSYMDLIMCGQNKVLHYSTFIYVNLTFYSNDRSTIKKYICDGNFEMHFVRE